MKLGHGLLLALEASDLPNSFDFGPAILVAKDLGAKGIRLRLDEAHSFRFWNERKIRKMVHALKLEAHSHELSTILDLSPFECPISDNPLLFRALQEGPTSKDWGYFQFPHTLQNGRVLSELAVLDGELFQPSERAPLRFRFTLPKGFFFQVREFSFPLRIDQYPEVLRSFYLSCEKTLGLAPHETERFWSLLELLGNKLRARKPDFAIMRSEVGRWFSRSPNRIDAVRGYCANIPHSMAQDLLERQHYALTQRRSNNLTLPLKMDSDVVSDKVLAPLLLGKTQDELVFPWEGLGKLKQPRHLLLRLYKKVPRIWAQSLRNDVDVPREWPIFGIQSGDVAEQIEAFLGKKLSHAAMHAFLRKQVLIKKPLIHRTGPQPTLETFYLLAMLPGTMEIPLRHVKDLAAHDATRLALIVETRRVFSELISSGKYIALKSIPKTNVFAFARQKKDEVVITVVRRGKTVDSIIELPTDFPKAWLHLTAERRVFARNGVLRVSTILGTSNVAILKGRI